MSLKVFSLNLWNGGRLLDEALRFLKAQSADIMLFQEAYDGQDSSLERRLRTTQELRKAFPDYDSSFAPVYLDTRDKEGEIEDGQFLMSCFPILDHKNIYFDIPYGRYDQDGVHDFTLFPATCQVARVNIQGRVVRILNVHGPVWLDGTVDTDRRLMMKDALLKEMNQAQDQQEAIILGGDFNVQPQTQTRQDLKQFVQPVLADNKLKTTFNMKRKSNPGYATAPVDMIYVSPEFSVLEAECLEEDISDHLPILARLELEESRSGHQ